MVEIIRGSNIPPRTLKPIRIAGYFYLTADSLEEEAVRLMRQAIQNTYQQVLIFDLDNYIGRAVNKKEEIVQAREERERIEKLEEEAKSYYFPPEEDEPEELVEMAEQVQRAMDLNKKIFGTPAFKHASTFRSIDGDGTWEEWLAPARPLDTNHKFDENLVRRMLRDIQDDPPELPQDDPPETGGIIDATVAEVNSSDEEGE